MRADNRGEGGMLALIALVERSVPDSRRARRSVLVMLGHASAPRCSTATA